MDNANYLNGEKGLDVDVDNLYVKQAAANDGPRMKRIRPAPKGRAYRYVRRMAHSSGVGGEEKNGSTRRRTRPAKDESAGDGEETGTPRNRRRKKNQAAKKPTAKKGSRFQVSRFRVSTAQLGVSIKTKQCQIADLLGIRSDDGTKSPSLRFRLGYTKPWKSRWFVERDYDKLLLEDEKLKAELKEKLKSAGVSAVEIERPGNKLRIIIRTARPGIIIGRKGAEIDKLKQEVQKRTNREVHVDIQEVHKPELDAQLVAESIALQLEKRVGFRRAMRKSVDSALRFGCKGIKVRVSGRLNGNEIARSEWYLQGRLPLHTLRADIDYGFTEAEPPMA